MVGSLPSFDNDAKADTGFSGLWDNNAGSRLPATADGDESNNKSESSRFSNAFSRLGLGEEVPPRSSSANPLQSQSLLMRSFAGAAEGEELHMSRQSLTPNPTSGGNYQFNFNLFF